MSCPYNKGVCTLHENFICNEKTCDIYNAKQYNVCANYCGSVVSLAEFKDKEKAEEFMKHDFIMFYADELGSGEDDEIISPGEMWLEEKPFYELQEMNKEELYAYYGWADELPF